MGEVRAHQSDRGEWLASLPTVYAGASLLATDERGNILIVKPTYRATWTLPGGGVEAGEDPYQAAVRELKEETGLTAPMGMSLLLVAWAQPDADWDKQRAQFVFDAGTWPSGSAVTLPEEELEGYLWASPQHAARMLSPGAAELAAQAMRARGTKEARFIRIIGQGAPRA